jgi:osmotically inducible lipoprotein OsmB
MERIAVIVLAGALLCGCGTTMGDRGLSGAGIGAGIGIIGGPPGVIVGGVVGAGVGMVSSPRRIDLGRPFWRA